MVSSWIFINDSIHAKARSRTVITNLYNLRIVNIFRLLIKIVFKPVKKHVYFKYKETHTCKQAWLTLAFFLEHVNLNCVAKIFG